ncbi:MAG: HD domain-containing protein, partial [Spirochaetales bacterium]|nr:HD domain-containing protein [Spirochaetales bacterium]
KHWPLALSPGAERFLGDWDKSVTQNSQNHRLATVMSQQNILRSYQWTPAPGKTLHLMVGAPLKDFLTEALLMRQRILITALMVLLITAPVAFFWGIRLARALQELTLDAERIGALDFTGNLKVNSPIYEYWRLEQAFDVMKGTIAERTKDLQESNQHLAMLVDMGIAMSTETDIDSLSTMILSNAKELTHADSGVLFLVNPEKTQLNFHIVLNDSLQGSSPQNTSFKPINLYDEQGNENRQQMAAYCYHSRESMAVDDVYDSPRFTLTGFQNFDAERGYKSQSALTVPLKTWGSGTPLGVLLLINATHPKTHKILPFPKDLISYVEALSAGAAGVLQNHNLLRQHKKLFDELAQFIGSAIGGKSPHTARHCARVPVVARIIADAAEAVTEGPLANFSFENDAQRREFEIAAWLHDCGKVTTPEYVIDKATKLETIGNRIHEIRTRFEVLHRDATIAYKDALLSGAPPDMAQQKLEQKKAALHEDFAFLAQCNLGDRPLREEEIQRIKSISHRVWTRHFDDSLGLSWQELERLNAVENQDHQKLPVLERLLADKPQHLIPRDDDAREEYAKLGFTFPIPEYLYNRGEIHNLSVRAGTLSPEERFKINEHIAQSILMLSQLDFPDDLKKVVELAGSHHETPDGKGYPRGLNNQDLSIPAKILAIADIFEALTSSDRPYKRDKTLSETFDILYDMKEAHKIDPHLFDMLVSSGAYMDYARGYLKPRQIDEVEAARYQNSTPPA